MLQSLARLIIKALGWKLIEPPNRPARMLIVAYPHTSNWDALYALLTGLALELRANWAAKDSLFFWPIGGLLQRLGGIPVNRRQRTGFVDQMVERFASDPNCILIMAPEGTRKKADKIKSGFYYIAYEAHIPIVMFSFDYENKTIHCLGVFEPTGHFEQDLEQILQRYVGKFSPKNPDWLAKPLQKQWKKH